MPDEASAIICFMKLSELGELGLISLIHDVVAKSQDPECLSWQKVMVGIGDDAAAWQGDEHIQLATTDTLVQDIHFDLRLIKWEELGWKALAVNLSDIAAMGGVPNYALLSLALPAKLRVEDISSFVTSMVALAREFGVAIIGGNTVAAPSVLITMTVIGYCKNSDLLRRSTALPGEQIAVTGYLGSSAAGLEMLRGKTISDPETREFLRRAHFKPMPRIKEGQTLVEEGVRTAIDISDGLVADLEHVCESSRVGAIIKTEQLPVHPFVRANFPTYQNLALYGGEDYELLFTADPATLSRVKKALGCPVTIIGEITEESQPRRVTIIDDKGRTVPYQRGGWEHFKDGSTRVKFIPSRANSAFGKVLRRASSKV